MLLSVEAHQHVVELALCTEVTDDLWLSQVIEIVIVPSDLIKNDWDEMLLFQGRNNGTKQLILYNFISKCQLKIFRGIEMVNILDMAEL